MSCQNDRIDFFISYFEQKMDYFAIYFGKKRP